MWLKLEIGCLNLITPYSPEKNNGVMVTFEHIHYGFIRYFLRVIQLSCNFGGTTFFQNYIHPAFLHIIANKIESRLLYINKSSSTPSYTVTKPK